MINMYTETVYRLRNEIDRENMNADHDRLYAETWTRERIICQNHEDVGLIVSTLWRWRGSFCGV